MKNLIRVLVRAKDYDCVIIGAGPAGLAAGLYTSRDKLKTLILEKLYPGSHIRNTANNVQKE